MSLALEMRSKGKERICHPQVLGSEEREELVQRVMARRRWYAGGKESQSGQCTEH